MQHDHVLKKWILTFWIPGSAYKIFVAMWLHSWFHLIWYKDDHVLKSWHLIFGIPGSRRIWGQNICYHVVAFVIIINLICNMTMFWKSWILISSPGSWGVVKWLGVCTQNIWYLNAAFVIPFNLICNMTIFWKFWILTFWPHPWVRGGGSAGKIFATILLHSWFLLIW